MAALVACEAKVARLCWRCPAVPLTVMRHLSLLRSCHTRGRRDRPGSLAGGWMKASTVQGSPAVQVAGATLGKWPKRSP